MNIDVLNSDGTIRSTLVVGEDSYDERVNFLLRKGYTQKSSTEFYYPSEAPVDPTPPASDTWKITKLAFDNRWTETELVALELASTDNPSAPIQQRQLAAALRRRLKKVDQALNIDLKEPQTILGVQQTLDFLMSMGVISPANRPIREKQILTAPPTDKEKWSFDV